MIPSTDIVNGQVFVFKSNYDKDFTRDPDIKISDAVLSSCCAPVYFNPNKVGNYLLADGGLWANNPVLVGITEALSPRFNKNIDEVKILSFHTRPTKASVYLPRIF